MSGGLRASMTFPWSCTSFPYFGNGKGELTAEGHVYQITPESLLGRFGYDQVIIFLILAVLHLARLANRTSMCSTSNTESVMRKRRSNMNMHYIWNDN